MTARTATIISLRNQTATIKSTDSVGLALNMAVESFDEALLRLRSEALPSHANDPQDDSLVLRVESGVRT